MKARIIKRLGATIMALIMVLAMGTTALADNSVSAGDGDNSLVIHKFQKPEDANELPNDGTELDEDLIESFTPVSGIEFTVYSAMLTDPADEGSINVADYTLTEVVVGITNSDGLLEFTGLENGLYYVMETKSATSTDVTGFLVNLPMTNPTGDGTLSRVHVYPKNVMTSASIKKQVLDGTTPGSSTNADVGDAVTWRITAVVPGEFANADTEEGTEDYYKITDVLDKSLTYSSAVVKLAGTELVATDDYTVETEVNADDTTEVVISFTEAGMAKLVAALATTDATITVDLTTVINENAYEGMKDAEGDYAITNQASSEWQVGDKTGTEITPEPDPNEPNPEVPQVIVTGLLIYKTDESKVPLAGAKFKIANGADEDADGYKADLEKTTDDNGYAYWKSAELTEAFDTNLGNFYALETAAPAGYAVIIGHQAFAVLTASNVSAVLELQNFSANFELPLTGGIGTVIFTIGGLLLLAAAGVVISISKKKSGPNVTE